MYFIQQLQKQFFAQIFSYADSREQEASADTGETSKAPEAGSSENFGVSEKAFQKLAATKQEQLKVLFNKLSALEKDVVDNNLDKTFLSTGAKILARIETDASYKPTAPEDTKAYNGLVEKLKSYKERIGKIDTDNVQKLEQISMLSMEISQILGEIPSQKSEGNIDEEMVAQEEKDYAVDEILDGKIKKLEESVIQIGDISGESAKKIFDTHGYGVIQKAITRLEEIPQGEKTKEQKELLGKYESILSLNDRRELPEGEVLKTMSYDEFIEKIPLESRIKYFSQEGYTAGDLKENTSFTVSFRYFGKENIELADSVTAGQIFPENISQVDAGGVTYERKGLKGEFFAVKDGKNTAERLSLFDGNSVTIKPLRDTESLGALKGAIDTSLQTIPQESQNVARKMLEKGLDYDSQAAQVIGELSGKTGKYTSAVVENAVTDIAETIGNPEAFSINDINIEELKKQGIVGAILGFILEMFQNKEDGSMGAGGQEYAGGIGISPEDVKKYGNTGAQLAQWVKGNGYPVYEGKPSYCGKNVGEALDHFGIKGLPQSGRNGADWANICRSRPNQFKQINCTPEEAPAGALISYERNTGGSKARQQSGHIEIALGQGKGYYFGKVANHPGGSNTAPKAGTYTVWMPISKTA